VFLDIRLLDMSKEEEEQSIRLFVNKMFVYVPVNSVMGFQLDNCSVFGLESRSTPVVRFHIGGVWFETNEVKFSLFL